MSNYPPGVSGLEYEIAGPDSEWEEEDFECTNDSLEYVMISPYAFKVITDLCRNYANTKHLESIKENLYRRLAGVNSALNVGPDTEIVISNCGYVGGVIKQSYRDDIWWECPRCKKSYEKKIERYYGDDDY